MRAHESQQTVSMRTRLFARLLLVLAPECISAMRPQRPDLRPPRPAHAQLTLIRHGQSEWNLANRFTGWMDVDLTERGIIEARQAGRMLHDEGLTVCDCRIELATRHHAVAADSCRTTLPLLTSHARSLVNAGRPRLHFLLTKSREIGLSRPLSEQPVLRANGEGLAAQ